MSKMISKRKIKITKSIMLVVVVLSISAVGLFNSVAFARGMRGGQMWDNSPTRVPQILDNIANARCERIKLRVNERINLYNSRKESFQNRHNLVLQRVDEIIERFQGKGYDLAKIKADRENIAKLKDEFVKLHDKLIKSLEDLRTSTCNGASKEEFDSKLDNFKNNLKLKREKANEIRRYIQENLVPHIQELRDRVNS